MRGMGWLLLSKFNFWKWKTMKTPFHLHFQKSYKEVSFFHWRMIQSQHPSNRFLSSLWWYLTRRYSKLTPCLQKWEQPHDFQVIQSRRPTTSLSFTPSVTSSLHLHLPFLSLLNKGTLKRIHGARNGGLPFRFLSSTFSSISSLNKIKTKKGGSFHRDSKPTTVHSIPSKPNLLLSLKGRKTKRTPSVLSSWSVLSSSKNKKNQPKKTSPLRSLKKTSLTTTTRSKEDPPHRRREPIYTDSYLLVRYLSHLIRQSRMDEALDVLVRSRRAHVHGGTVVPWNVVMQAYGHQGAFSMVFKVFNMMKKRGGVPDFYTYTTLFQALDRASSMSMSNKDKWVEKLWTLVKEQSPSSSSSSSSSRTKKTEGSMTYLFNAYLQVLLQVQAPLDRIEERCREHVQDMDEVSYTLLLRSVTAHPTPNPLSPHVTSHPVHTYLSMTLTYLQRPHGTWQVDVGLFDALCHACRFTHSLEWMAFPFHLLNVLLLLLPDPSGSSSKSKSMSSSSRFPRPPPIVLPSLPPLSSSIQPWPPSSSSSSSSSSGSSSSIFPFATRTANWMLLLASTLDAQRGSQGQLTREVYTYLDPWVTLDAMAGSILEGAVKRKKAGVKRS